MPTREILTAGIMLLVVFAALAPPAAAQVNVCNSGLQINYPDPVPGAPFPNVDVIIGQQILVSLIVKNENPVGGLAQSFDFLDFFAACDTTGVNGVDCTIDPGLGGVPPITPLPANLAVLAPLPVEPPVPGPTVEGETCPAVDVQVLTGFVPPSNVANPGREFHERASALSLLEAALAAWGPPSRCSWHRRHRAG